MLLWLVLGRSGMAIHSSARFGSMSNSSAICSGEWSQIIKQAAWGGLKNLLCRLRLLSQSVLKCFVTKSVYSSGRATVRSGFLIIFLKVRTSSHSCRAICGYMKHLTEPDGNFSFESNKVPKYCGLTASFKNRHIFTDNKSTLQCSLLSNDRKKWNLLGKIFAHNYADWLK